MVLMVSGRNRCQWTYAENAILTENFMQPLSILQLNTGTVQPAVVIKQIQQQSGIKKHHIHTNRYAAVVQYGGAGLHQHGAIRQVMQLTGIVGWMVGVPLELIRNRTQPYDFFPIRPKTYQPKRCWCLTHGIL